MTNGLWPRRAVFALPLLAATPARADGYAQGGFVSACAKPGSRITLDGRALRVGPGGEYAFGFGRDHGPEAVLTITPPGGRAETQRLSVARRQWQVQRISGLPPGQVTPDPDALRRIQAEREELRTAREIDSARTDFAQGFVLPARGRVSGVFGSQRILNGEPRQPHFGFDIAAPTGAPIVAAGAGQVTLAASFFFFGNLIVLDHGHGVNTLYAHCSAIDVTEGQVVSAGQRIGAIGATGRVTGPHLHFCLSWFVTWLDPQPVLPPVTG